MGLVESDGVMAIDVLLEPDAAMMQRAEADNARLRHAYPAGFALDATHRPHITLLQCFVRSADLAIVHGAVGKVLVSERVAGWQLKAVRYYYIPAGEIGIAGIIVEPTEDLRRLQRALVEAAGPLTVDSGTAAAFATAPGDPEISPRLIDHVARFVAGGTGVNFNPHVTIGVASRDYLDDMLAEPFAEFAFSPMRAAVFQLGDFGTARKQLQTWDLTRPRPGT
jgi:hypothetical protein